MIGRAAVAVGLAGVLAAAGARRPVLRRWPLSIAQAAPCLPASEAPGPMSGVHAATALVSLLRGDLAGAAANAAALLALAGLRADARRSAEVLAEALTPLGAPIPHRPARPGGRRRAAAPADACCGSRTSPTATTRRSGWTSGPAPTSIRRAARRYCCRCTAAGGPAGTRRSRARR